MVFLVLLGIEQVLLLVRSIKAKENEVCASDNTCTLSPDTNNTEAPKEVVPQTVVENLPTDSTIQELQNEINVGLDKHQPQRSEEGTSGVYFMRNAQGKKIAVFKPKDEEGASLRRSIEMRPGCTFGEGYLKEVAAHIIDKDGFHGVPRTAIAKFSHKAFHNPTGTPQQKEGSLQEFVSYESTAEEMGWKKFTAHDVHKIGLLDCRILNLDRHLGNILVTEDEDESIHLVPIDHAFSFPSFITGGASFEWLQFPQCKQPFDKETVDYICNIDVESDVQTIRRRLPGLQEGCIETMQICTIFLKEAVARGLNMYQIGCMMSRHLDERQPSHLERLYSAIQARAAPATNDTFAHIVSEEVDTILAQF